MKRIIYTLMALGLVGVTFPAIAEDNKDTIETVIQSNAMQKDGSNMKAVQEGRKSVSDFKKAHPGNFHVTTDFRDVEGSSR